MNPFISIDIKEITPEINLSSGVLLIGSCFSEHIQQRLYLHGVHTFSNPFGILYNPLGITNCFDDCINKRLIKEEELFQYQELWHSHLHHSDFSDLDRASALDKMNESIRAANSFITTQCTHLIITLGTAFQYYLDDKVAVNNNHKLPQHRFTKKLLSIDVIQVHLLKLITLVKSNTNIQKIIFTVSPVRHLRDGVVENNRSKARLIEAIHNVVAVEPQLCCYFEAYELVIDVLRDYRFYKNDMMHPNDLAIDYVWSKFMDCALDKADQNVMLDIFSLHKAAQHKPRFTKTTAHQKFLESNSQKLIALKNQYPFANFEGLLFE